MAISTTIMILLPTLEILLELLMRIPSIPLNPLTAVAWVIRNCRERGNWHQQKENVLGIRSCSVTKCWKVGTMLAIWAISWCRKLSSAAEIGEISVMAILLTSCTKVSFNHIYLVPIQKAPRAGYSEKLRLFGKHSLTFEPATPRSLATLAGSSTQSEDNSRVLRR